MDIQDVKDLVDTVAVSLGVDTDGISDSLMEETVAAAKLALGMAGIDVYGEESA